MDPFKNLVINLKATGPAAVICVWLTSMVVLAIWGSGSPLAATAMGIIGSVGAAFVFALTRPPQ